MILEVAASLSVAFYKANAAALENIFWGGCRFGCPNRAGKTFAACNLATRPLLPLKKLNINRLTHTHTLTLHRHNKVNYYASAGNMKKIS